MQPTVSPARLTMLALALASAASPRVSAFDADEVRARYTVTSWTEKDGMPSSYVRAIAQDMEGYLWLATYSGLVRFDGARFVTWKSQDGSALPSEDLSAIIVALDGSIWVGGTAGVSRIVKGRIVPFGSAGNTPSGNVSVILQDDDGAIWTGGQRGLARFDGAKWERFGFDQGLPFRPVLSLHKDEQDALWIGTSVGLYRRMPGSNRFEAVGSFSQAIEDVDEGADGAVVVTHPTQLMMGLAAASPAAGDPALRRSHGTRLLRDQEGNLWIGTRSQGVVRVHAQNDPQTYRVERITSADG